MITSSAFRTFVFCALSFCSGLFAEPVVVRYQEGSVRGYLALRSLEGKLLAAADLIQVVHGEHVTSRLIYRFKDGSLDDETAVFTQRGHFRLISDHHIQKGPVFPKPVDVQIQATTGEVTVRYEESGQTKMETSQMQLPADLSNGLLLNVLKNVSPKANKTEISYLAATPKPKLIKFVVQPEGQDMFYSAGRPNRALRFKIHVELGGMTGFIAPLIGKEPPDAHVWIETGFVPAFIRSESPLFLGGPMLRTELVSPVWARTEQQK